MSLRLYITTQQTNKYLVKPRFLMYRAIDKSVLKVSQIKLNPHSKVYMMNLKYNGTNGTIASIASTKNVFVNFACGQVTKINLSVIFKKKIY